MTLSLYDYIYGIAQMSAAFLAIVAGIIAISLIRSARKHKELRAWKSLIFALVIFVFVEVLGALKSFGFDVAPFWTHVLVSVILGLVILSLTTQIHVNGGWKE